MQFINKAYLLTGSNVGDRFFYLQLAVNYVNEQCGNVVKKSAIYETAPWGNTDQAAFLNQALELHTRFNAATLMGLLLKIEEQMGRKREEKYGPRIIDIDILLFNEEIHISPELSIPHKELPNRNFALQPLFEIAETYVHPVLKKTIRQLLAECRDKLPVKKISLGS